jgi:hypothetical protein
MAWWIDVISTDDLGEPVKSTYQVDATQEVVEALAREINVAVNDCEARTYALPEIFSVETFRAWEETALSSGQGA